MTTYYVNSSVGADANAGTSVNAPLASLAAVSALKLKPGDVVLFSSDNEYQGQLDVKYSGTVENPITFGSYGSGEPPVLTGGSVGIYGSKTSNIVIENLAIEKTVGNAIYAGSASNWTIQNVTVADTGTSAKAGSISFQSSSNITISECHISRTAGDGIWMLNVKGANLVRNEVSNAYGHDADAIQLNSSSNIFLKDNVLDMSGNNSSAKGVLVLVDAKGALVDGNVITGGGFGISAQGQDITITHNDISGYHGYSWSYGIGLGQQVDAKNYIISDNYIHDGVWGVSVSAAGTDTLTRTGISITGNHFDDLSSAALKVDRAASGLFEGNVITESVSKDIYLSQAVKDAGTFLTIPSEIASTGYQTSPPLVVEDTRDLPLVPNPNEMDLGSHSSPTAIANYLNAGSDTLVFTDVNELSFSGNVLTNDYSGNGVLLLRNLNGSSFKHSPVMNIESKYGVLHIERDGDYTFTVDVDQLDSLSGVVKETFQYKISNGAEIDAGYIFISIDADRILTSIVVDDFL
ncbi:right-handed parallel beta-helix repeat-containing protein [Agrobacterium sp. AGB01]|uniref:right-handed parallel beta-helix repeat-containing protein n=1 Tax=Agrobacterium sp. AGB01 TaxID=2769302 RepID=UPI001785386A|nr:right-handed parallel beta-helix repeat-containing protein [Agrobacterium sp. AGB01]MBD9388214.1 right-handed parallel beta-helix repeat-containing protein [Agrobacterium sp. AGB01]